MKETKKPKKDIQNAILAALEKPENKTVAAVCRTAGIARNTFYVHFNNSPEFRRQVLTKQREHLDRQIATV